MTLRQAAATRRQRQRQSSRHQPSSVALPPTGHNNPPPDRVLTFRQWYELNGISEQTGRRILASGNGPAVLQLSPRRLGIRMSDNLRWQESRIRTAGE